MKACPKCNGMAADITPLKHKDERISVYACENCGYAFRADGKAFVKDTEALGDMFASQGNQALVDMLLGTGEKLNKATFALLSARMVEYGLTMWMDGYKAGLLTKVKQEEYDGKVRSTEGNPS